MEDEVNTRSGQRIKELRKSARMTQERLASIIGVTKAAICKWEKGKTEFIKPHNAEKVGKVFGVNPLWVMGYDSPKETVDQKRQGLIQEISDGCSKLDEDKLNMVLMLVKSYINK